MFNDNLFYLLSLQYLLVATEARETIFYGSNLDT